MCATRAAGGERARVTSRRPGFVRRDYAKTVVKHRCLGRFMLSFVVPARSEPITSRIISDCQQTIIIRFDSLVPVPGQLGRRVV